MKTIKSMALGAAIGTIFGAGLLFSVSSKEAQNEILAKVSGALEVVQMTIQAQAQTETSEATTSTVLDNVVTDDSEGPHLDPNNSALANDERLIFHFRDAINTVAGELRQQAESIISRMEKGFSDAKLEREVTREQLDDQINKHMAYVEKAEAEIAAMHSKIASLESTIEGIQLEMAKKFEDLDGRDMSLWEKNNEQDAKLKVNYEAWNMLRDSPAGRLLN